VRYEEAQVEADRDSEQRLRPRPAAPAIEPQPEAEVGGDRDQHDEDEAWLAPAIEDEAHAEEPQVAQAELPEASLGGELSFVEVAQLVESRRLTRGLVLAHPGDAGETQGQP
jgi:hypothetical protein